MTIDSKDIQEYDEDVVVNSIDMHYVKLMMKLKYLVEDYRAYIICLKLSGKTLKQIGLLFNVSGERIRQREYSSLRQIRKNHLLSLEEFILKRYGSINPDDQAVRLYLGIAIGR